MSENQGFPVLTMTPEANVRPAWSWSRAGWAVLSNAVCGSIVGTVVAVSLLTLARPPAAALGAGAAVAVSLWVVSNLLTFHLMGLREAPLHPVRRTWVWVGYWARWVLTIVGMGALLGTVMMSLVALFWRPESLGEFVWKKGVLNGAFYGLIWAPGVAFVLAAMRAKGKRKEPGKGGFSGR